MTTAVEILAAQIENLRRQVVAMQSGSQLANSSIDNGQLLVTQNDGSGNQQVTTIVGTQFDGTSGAVVVAGPIPPVPGPPTLITAIGGVKVQWHGGFADPQPGFSSPVVAPLDFAGVDVEVSDDPGFPSIGFGTNHGTIVSAAGGEVFVSWPASNTPLYARLITRSKAGKFSNPGLTAGPVNSGQVQLGDLGFNITQFGGGTTIYYTVAPATPVAPAWGFTVGDIWLQEVGAASGVPGGQPGGTPTYTTSRWLGSVWQPLQDQGISNSLAAAILAQSMAAAKAQVFTQANPPIWSGVAGSAYWIDNTHDNVSNVWDGGQWVPYRIGNGAVQPNSLIASNVIATGTVSAALLEAQMVLTSTVNAGDPKGAHTTMEPTGFGVFTPTADGVVQVGRFGSDSSNFWAVADPNTGQMVSSVDATGAANFRSVNATSVSVGGQDLASYIGDVAPQAVGYFECFPPNNLPTSSNYGPIVATVGVFEVNAFLTAGRRYEIDWKGAWAADNFSIPGGTACECRWTIHYTTPVSAGSDTANAPLTSSTLLDTWIISAVYPLTFMAAEGTTTFVPTTTGRHRFLICLEKGAGAAAASVYALTGFKHFATVLDTGLGKSLTGQLSQGGSAFNGGSTPPPPPTPVQTYDTGWLAPSTFATYNGSGGLRTDTTDIVQGWDPSGFNGDGSGWWVWSCPTITGTINSIQLYIFNNFSYFNSGGQALISLIHGGPPNWPISGLIESGTGTTNFGTFPKPGPVTLNIPSVWWPYFLTSASPRAIGFALGPTGTTDETFYIRADGPSARLRFVYTQ